MIKTEKEYKEAVIRLEKEFKAIEAQQLKLKKAGLNKEQIKLALDPLASFALTRAKCFSGVRNRIY